MRVASLGTSFDSRFAPTTTAASSDAPAATTEGSSFDERFSGGSAARSRSLQPTVSFEDRFGAAVASPRVDLTAMIATPAFTGTVGLAPANEQANENAAPPETPHVAAAAPAPRTPTRSIAQPAPRQASYRVASLSDTPVPTAYAPADSGRDATITDLLKKLSLRGSTGNDATSQGGPRRDTAPSDAAPRTAMSTPTNPLGNEANRTAVYDISAHTVYMPNGDRLEAHSGLGEYMDDVHSVSLKHYGPTPPNVYELRLREAPFHGVQAIRLNPLDGSQMFGRDGILAHPFMLGPNGQSNGCVSFKDYDAFLRAYQRGEVTRMVVVERLDDPPGSRTASDWLSNTLKGIFGRS